MLKSLLVLASFSLAALLSAPAGAQSASARPAEGSNYVVLSPAQPVDADGKIEVIEFFWYGCPHCYKLEPLVDVWQKSLPKDAVFKRVPAVFNDQWAIAARVYYTLDALGEETRVRRALFDAIHKEGLKITDESDMAAWAGKHGIDAQKFKAAYNSFAVQGKVARAQQMTQSYKLNGVPTFVVQGKYLAGAEMNGDGQPLLDVTSYLVAQVEKQGKGAGKAASAAPTAKKPS
jgi:thiol:disulfide interchange protein DsbA